MFTEKQSHGQEANPVSSGTLVGTRTAPSQPQLSSQRVTAWDKWQH